ncbi:MAG TPA: rhodanese-like domain-containing protein [Flavobacteriaceae bacterium]|nr:rhodanese-like domain-containing protein [Flavobacteriaceae bacterium]
MGILSRIFGLKPKTDYKKLLQQGAIIIDVRSAAEFSNGHIKKSKNIPLESLHNRTSKFKKDKPIILCCATGMRSGTARRSLKSQGFEVYNGGGWLSLDRKLQ